MNEIKRKVGRPKNVDRGPHNFIDKGQLKERKEGRKIRDKNSSSYFDERCYHTELVRHNKRLEDSFPPQKDEPNATYSLRGIDIDWDRIERENRHYEKLLNKKKKLES